MASQVKPFTQEDKQRIMSKTAEKHGGQIPKESFAAKVQHIVDKQPPKK